MISIAASGSGARFLIGGPHLTCLRCVRREIGRRGREGQRGAERGAEGHIAFGSRLAFVACCGTCGTFWTRQPGSQPTEQTGSPSQLAVAACGAECNGAQKRAASGRTVVISQLRHLLGWLGWSSLLLGPVVGLWRERVESGWRDRVIGAVGGSSTADEGEAQCSNTPVAGAVDNTGGRGRGMGHGLLERGERAGKRGERAVAQRPESNRIQVVCD
jgi:hypothetical protein